MSQELAEEFFGEEPILDWPPAYDSRCGGDGFASEEDYLIRLKLEVAGQPTPSFPRGFGVRIAEVNNRPIRLGWLLQRYRDQFVHLLAEFGYVFSPFTYPNLNNNPGGPFFTPQANSLMHVDGFHESSGRKNWDFTQLSPHYSLHGLITRRDPTLIADTGIFTEAFLPKLDASISSLRKIDQQMARVVGNIRDQLFWKNSLARVWRLTAILCSIENLHLRRVIQRGLLSIQKEAFESCEIGTLKVDYQSKGEGSVHLVLGADGLGRDSFRVLHGRLYGIKKDPSFLEGTFYPLMPRTSEGSHAVSFSKDLTEETIISE